jgi:RNA polymerase sigma factor (sigma-70 family)
VTSHQQPAGSEPPVGDGKTAAEPSAGDGITAAESSAGDAITTGESSAGDGKPAADRIHRTIEAVFRLESARLIGGLARLVRDVGLAEEIAQDALVAALEQWPADGVPNNPGAWLMSVGRRRAIDLIRRSRSYDSKLAEIGRELQIDGEGFEHDIDALLDDNIGDDRLRLIFVACHPVLSVPARVAMTLRLLGGLTTAEIARAYLVPEATVAQRISRAKKALSAAQVPFEVPTGDDFAARLPSVLEAVYLIFNEGYTATSGDDWTRPDLCLEAVRLARILQGLVPDEPEVHALAALLELQSSRLAARVGAYGRPVLLLDQNRGRWDPLLIRRGMAALDRVHRLHGEYGYYALQAAVAACHARATRAEDTDWPRIAELYEMLVTVAPSPIVELNRAVAVAMAHGPLAGLELLDRLRDEPALRSYHLLPSVRGDLLVRMGRSEEARAEFARAAAMTGNAAERELLLERARTGA